MPSSRPNFLLTMVSEFRRACSAAQRYEDLRCRSAGGSIEPAEIAQRVFEEFYAFEKAAEVAPSRVASAAPYRHALPPP